MAKAFTIGNVTVNPGELSFGGLDVGYFNDGSPVTVPLLVMRGEKDGPVMWLGSAIHGIELAGSEVIRRTMREMVSPKTLRGTVIGAPIMNPPSFRASDRQNPLDRRDMNRAFGAVEVSMSSAMADNLYLNGINKADVVVDYHSCNPPSLDFTIIRSGESEVNRLSMDLAKAYGVTICRGEHEYGGGTLTARTIEDGKASVVVELVFSRRITEPTVQSGVRGTLNMMKKLGMIDGAIEPQSDVKVLDGFYIYKTINITKGGLVTLLKDVGEPVRIGEVFAIVRNIYGDVVEEVKSPVGGYVIAYPMQGNQSLGTGDKLAYLAYLAK